MPKMVRKKAEIWCIEVFRTNLQLIVLKILMVVSCEEGGFVDRSLLERVFFVGQGSSSCGGCFVVQGVVPKVVRKMAEIWCGGGSESGSESASEDS